MTNSPDANDCLDKIVVAFPHRDRRLCDLPRIDHSAPCPDDDPRQLTIHFAKVSHQYSLTFADFVKLACRYHISPEQLIHDLLVTEAHRQKLYVEKHGEPLVRRLIDLSEDDVTYIGPIDPDDMDLSHLPTGLIDEDPFDTPREPYLRLVAGLSMPND